MSENLSSAKEKDIEKGRGGGCMKEVVNGGFLSSLLFSSYVRVE